MTNKKPIYLAIDSDVLRTITLLYILKKEHGYVDVSKIKDLTLKNDFNYFTRLYNAVINNEIRPLIVDAVYQESKHSEHLLEFIKKLCYFPNVNAANYQEKAEKARELADAYTKPFSYIDRDGNEIKAEAPMKAVFVADINKYVPTNDCYIMAQATIENCPLLTANGQDFIFNKRSSNKYNHDRVKGIAEINISKGYYTENKNGRKETCRPITINTLSGLLKYEDYFYNLEQKDNFIKADNIL